MAKSGRILVVEDHPQWRNMLQQTLEGAGYAVNSAETLLGAVQRLQATKFDAVVVDVRLEDTDPRNFDGQLLLGHLLEKALPAVVVTAYATPELARRAFRRYNVVDFIDKAEFDKDEFLQVVSEATRTSARQRRHVLAEERRRFFQGEVIKIPVPPSAMNPLLPPEPSDCSNGG